MIQDEEKFKMYFQELKDIYEGYIKFVITMSTTIILSIGWFITSDKARDFTRGSNSVKYSLVIAAILTALIEFYMTFRIKNLFTKVSKIVGESANSIGLSVDYYKYRVISPSMMYVLYSFHLILLALFVILICKG